MDDDGQVNGESLLGTRHQRAVDIIRSLQDTVLFLICDGYNDHDVLPSVSAKVSRGQGFGSQGHTVVTEEASQGHGPQFGGHEMMRQKIGRSQSLTVQGCGDQCQGHKVGQGQGLVFEGHVEVNSMTESTIDEYHRERARQRRQARYYKSN